MCYVKFFAHKLIRYRQLIRSFTDIRPDILETSLKYVPQYGWSRSSIIKGLFELDLPPISHAIFVHGGYDLIYYYNEKCKNFFIKWLDDQTLNYSENYHQSIQRCKTELLINSVIKFMELNLLFYIQKFPQIVKYSFIPHNLIESLKYCSAISNLIVYHLKKFDIIANSNLLPDTSNPILYAFGPYWYIERLSIALTLNYAIYTILNDYEKNNGIVVINSIASPRQLLDKDDPININIETEEIVTSKEFESNYRSVLHEKLRVFVKKVQSVQHLTQEPFKKFSQKDHDKPFARKDENMREKTLKTRPLSTLICNLIGL